jgi:hypothetical protein
MRMTLPRSILGLCLLSQGCGPITLATRTLVIEPIHYCATATNILETRRNYQLADETWQAIAEADPDHLYSPDYVYGFKDGFADYLYAGGTGEPPPMPPRHYWRLHYETPEGHLAIADWFAGFRHGAAVAQDCGYRQWVTIPTSVPRHRAAEAEPPPLRPQSPAVPPEPPVLPPPQKIQPPQDPEDGEIP